MVLKVRLFAAFRELAGRGEVEVDLPDGGEVEQLLQRLFLLCPQLQPYHRAMAVAVNQRVESWQYQLRAGDEVALLPPVSGGRSAHV